MEGDSDKDKSNKVNPNYPMPPGHLPGVSMQTHSMFSDLNGRQLGHQPGYELVPRTEDMPETEAYQQASTKYPSQTLGAGHILTGNPATTSLESILNQIQTGFYIKMKPDYAEMLIGCDRRKFYTVYELDQDGTSRRNIPLFECKELTTFCQRNCAPPLCRAIELAFRKISNDPAVESEDCSFKLVKECQGTFLCFKRPVVKMYTTENHQENYLGRVTYPWNCCNYLMNCSDEAENLNFKIEARCCQIGLMARCPCDSYQRVEFDLLSGRDFSVKTPITKLGTGSCLRNSFTLMEIGRAHV